MLVSATSTRHCSCQHMAQKSPNVCGNGACVATGKAWLLIKSVKKWNLYYRHAADRNCPQNLRLCSAAFGHGHPTDGFCFVSAVRPRPRTWKCMDFQKFLPTPFFQPVLGFFPLFHPIWSIFKFWTFPAFTFTIFVVLQQKWSFQLNFLYGKWEKMFMQNWLGIGVGIRRSCPLSFPRNRHQTGKQNFWKFKKFLSKFSINFQ